MELKPTMLIPFLNPPVMASELRERDRHRRLVVIPYLRIGLLSKVRVVIKMRVLGLMMGT